MALPRLGAKPVPTTTLASQLSAPGAKQNFLDDMNRKPLAAQLSAPGAKQNWLANLNSAPTNVASAAKPQKTTKIGSTMTTPHIKTASEATPERLSQIDQFDAAQAFEIGFAKAAHDLGLNEADYGKFYAIAVEKLAAEQAAK